MLKYCAGFAELTAQLTPLTKGKSRNEKVVFSPGQLQEPDVPQSLIRNYLLSDGLLYFRAHVDAAWRLYIPNDVDTKYIVVREEYDTRVRGHPRRHVTLRFLRALYYWPRMTKFVVRYIASCERCQRKKSSRAKPDGHLNPIDIPSARLPRPPA